VAAPLRLGLVGAGRWGRNYIRTIASLPGLRLSRLASGNPESAGLVPTGCAIFADWRDLVGSGELDGLIVAAPPATHAQIASAAIEAGLPVLIEKPLTLDLDEARMLLERAKAHGSLAMAAHTHLCHPAYRALKSRLPGFGAVREIRSEASNVGPFRRDAPVLWDWGAHDVAMCLDLLGTMPERAKAAIVETRAVESSKGETVDIELGFAGGISATTRVSNLLPKRRVFSVRCAKATLTYNDLVPEKLTIEAQGSALPQPVKIPADLPLTVVVREFAAAIAAGSADPSSLELGVAVVAVLARCAGSV
jgi:predicted dehydrogenase